MGFKNTDLECHAWIFFLFLINHIIHLVHTNNYNHKQPEDDKEMVWRAHMIKELVMVHDGVRCLSSDESVEDDVRALISYQLAEWFYPYFYLILSFLLLLFISFYFLYIVESLFLSCMYLEYNLLE